MHFDTARKIAYNLSEAGYAVTLTSLRGRHLEWLRLRGKIVTESDYTVDVTGTDSHTIAWEIGRLNVGFQGVFTHNDTVHRFY